ncbi:MAG: hypothetical protein HN509_12925 [Halobacteriovoraceae bacterium]|jgi:hypothetical protein|nr:hypothetical protein [Halobacteriovoraceae bacterium]MBT5094614.1 hypothetical protein [Halobacteriovoraceae bacterium]
MRKLIVVFFVICTPLSALPAIGKEWRVTVFMDHFFLQKLSNKKLMKKIKSVGGRPRFERVILNKKSKVQLLVYFAGTAGTSFMVETYRAVIFDTNSKKFLGDFPFAYKGSKKIKQPRWIFDKGHISIDVDDINLHKRIKL